ncbi:MAG TPA: hypothetical protein VGD78_02745 [Chthoniobacterales bacterium]
MVKQGNNAPEIDRVLTELNAWRSAEHGPKAEPGKLLGVTRPQEYDWTVKRRLPNRVMRAGQAGGRSDQRKGSFLTPNPDG